MRRRQFIAGVAGLAVAPLGAGAQQPALRVRKIGLLQGLTANDPDWQRRLSAFRQGLAKFGWLEGRNIAFEYRHADAKPERLPELAAELVKAQVDIIVTNAAQPVEAARDATRTIPIVMASVGDALGGGYVASLARPGGNITGFTLVATDQSAKRLELIKEISPGLERAAVLWNANASGHRRQWPEMEAAGPKLGIALQSMAVRSLDDIAEALRAVGTAQALVTMDDPMI